jgi:hypothetical protein
MEALNEEEIRMEENLDQVPPKEPRQNNEVISSTQVLETMMNLIVEMQMFKEDNEKPKKEHEEQQKINEVFLRSIVTIMSPKDNKKEEEVNKRSSKNYGPKKEKENSSSEGSQVAENKTSTGRKRKRVDHLEGEFKKIKPSTFDGKSRTGEEVEVWLLDINKYFHIYNYSINMKV